MTRVAAVIHLLVPACRPALHKWSGYLLIPCEWLLSLAVLSSDFPLVSNRVVVIPSLWIDPWGSWKNVCLHTALTVANFQRRSSSKLWCKGGKDLNF